MGRSKARRRASLNQQSGMGAIHEEVEPAASTLTISLSGGGFRAMLFHLGVIKALRAAQSHGLGMEIKRIIGVSGGSIVAAHVALNWEKYELDPRLGTRDDVRFHKVTKELIDLAQADVRGKMVRLVPGLLVGRVALAVLCLFTAPLRMIPPLHKLRRWTDGLHGVFTTAWVLEREISRVLQQSPTYRQREGSTRHKGTLRCLSHPTSTSPVPEVHIVATNITAAARASFSAGGIRLGERTPYDATVIKIAKAVTASCALPGLINPVKFHTRPSGQPHDLQKEVLLA